MKYKLSRGKKKRNGQKYLQSDWPESHLWDIFFYCCCSEWGGATAEVYYHKEPCCRYNTLVRVPFLVTSCPWMWRKISACHNTQMAMWFSARWSCSGWGRPADEPHVLMWFTGAQQEARAQISPASCVFKRNEFSLQATCLEWHVIQADEAQRILWRRCCERQWDAPLISWHGVFEQQANICFDQCRSLKLPCNLMEFHN